MPTDTNLEPVVVVSGTETLMSIALSEAAEAVLVSQERSYSTPAEVQSLVRGSVLRVLEAFLSCDGPEAGPLLDQAVVRIQGL